MTRHVTMGMAFATVFLCGLAAQAQVPVLIQYRCEWKGVDSNGNKCIAPGFGGSPTAGCTAAAANAEFYCSGYDGNCDEAACQAQSRMRYWTLRSSRCCLYVAIVTVCACDNTRITVIDFDPCCRVARCRAQRRAIDEANRSHDGVRWCRWKCKRTSMLPQFRVPAAADG